MQDVQAFFDAIKDDPKVQELLMAAKDEQDFVRMAAEVARERNFSVSEEAIQQFITAQRAPIPDEELEKVAGGGVPILIIDQGNSGINFDSGDVPPSTASMCPNPYTNAGVYPGIC